MYDYIHEQEEIIQKIVNSESYEIELDKYENIYIVGSGSSYNAGLLQIYLLDEFKNNIHVIDPYDFNTLTSKYLTKKDCVVVLSQTGKSTGTLEAVDKANESGAYTIAFTAYDDCPLALKAKRHINIQCGDEPIGPKTKGYLATTLSLHKLFAETFDLDWNNLKLAYVQEANRLSETIFKSFDWFNKNKDWSKAEHMVIVGYGSGNATAREGALKVMETLRIPIVNYTLEEFMHGPQRLINEKTHIFTIHNNGVGESLLEGFNEYMKQETSHMMNVSNIDKDADIYVEEINPKTHWVQEVVVFQVLSAALPLEVGIDPAAPVFADFATFVGTRVK